jgi:hypothetical protein
LRAWSWLALPVQRADHPMNPLLTVALILASSATTYLAVALNARRAH